MWIRQGSCEFDNRDGLACEKTRVLLHKGQTGRIKALSSEKRGFFTVLTGLITVTVF
jgi:hypothetical protein